MKEYKETLEKILREIEFNMNISCVERSLGTVRLVDGRRGQVQLAIETDEDEFIGDQE